MLSHPVSLALIGKQLQAQAQSYLEQARLQKTMQHLEMALALYDQAKVTFRHAADARQLVPALSEVKGALSQARTPKTSEEEALRQRIAEVYFERAELLEKLEKADKAQASYNKAQKWGHPGVAPQPSSLSAYAMLHPAALTSRSLIAAQTSGNLHAPAQLSPVNLSSSIPADIPSTLAEPAQNAALSPRILEGIQEKNDLINQLFAETLRTFQSLDLSSVWPSAFLVYAHDNPYYGMADAGTSKFLIDHLVKLGVNLYSDQRPKGLQGQAALITREEAARVDDILTSQFCLLPTAIGGAQPVDKVIVCGSQVLGRYLQWGEAGKHYQAYYKDLKKAYGVAQHNSAQAEAEIRKVVNTYSQQADFHHVLTEMAFLKIRTDYLDQHGIIPVSLCANGYALCVQDFVKATTVRIEDMPRFASQQASGQAMYQQQGRHLVFFKLLERLLAQNGAEALLRTFWTAYSDLIKRLNSEASVPKAAEYIRVWGQISQNVQATLQTLRTQVDAHELRTALTRYASLDRLAIQRLSGPPLSMKDCYINLAIVEHEKVRKEEKKPKKGKGNKPKEGEENQPKKVEENQPEEGEENQPKEGEAAQNHFHRLPSFEAIDSNKQKLVSLEKLFDPRVLTNGKTVTPQRILIRGRAGVGKTTLSKKIVYEYTQKAQWRDRFDWLLWIPLRTLKGKSSCDLATLFHETYFQSYPNGQALAKALEVHINGPAKDRALFVLDGWDEVAQEWGEHEPMSEFLKQLLNQPAVLITSRPYVELKQVRAMDLELETVGFSPENVTAYLDHRDMITASDAKEVKHFIQANAFIQGLVNVPIQLDALCYSWDEIKRMQKEVPGAMTVTALYQAMINKLWRKDMLRLGKREDGERLTASQINALERSSRIEKLVKTEHDFLSILAFRGLQRNQIEFNHRDLHGLIEQLEAQGVNIPITLEANLKKLSFLHTDDAKETQRSYHFMHLTFQEFFAAKHFVGRWEAAREINLLSADTKRWTKVTPEAFVRQHKYNPRYEILWWFVAGLLRGEALNRFFILLEAEPRDLLGAHHQRVIMSCLHETSRTPGVGLSPEIRNRLEQGLAQWLQFEIDKRGECTLAYQPTFPEHLLLQCLQKTTSAQTKQAVATAFRHRSALSDSALQALIALLKDWNMDVRRCAAEALGQQSSSPDSVLQALIALLKDVDGDVRRSAAEALGKQSSLPDSVLQALIALLKDKYLGRSAAEALCNKQSSLPDSVLQALIALLKDVDGDVRRSAAEALGKQSSLPDSVLQALIAWLKDGDGNVRRSAAEALGKQSSLSDSVLQALIALLKDWNMDVRRRAAEALGQQSSSPEPALLGLIALAKDKYQEVRSRAAEALGKQSLLPEPALLALIALAKDKYKAVRSRAAEALGKQSLLPEPALLALIALLKDVDGDVRRSAAEALGQQSSLPEPALLALIALLKDVDGDVRRSAAEALGQQSSLRNSALQALIALLKDVDGDVRRSAADALSQQSSLPDSALLTLIVLLKDGDVRHSAAYALNKQSSFPETALQALIVLLKDVDGDVRRSAADALGQHSSFPESALQALIALAKDKNPEVKCSAAYALSQHSSLPDSPLQALIVLAKDKNWVVKCSAVYALSQHSSLPESAMQALIVLAKDRNWVVKCSAADALGQQSSLPKSALQALIALAKDKSLEVKCSAAYALSQHSSLPASALQALIALAKDEDEDVRCGAADALGKQSLLSDSALQTLIALAKDKNWMVKRSAVDALGKHSSLSDSALQVLIALAKDGDWDMRRSAADALGQQSLLPDSVLMDLIALLKDEGRDVRSHAADVLSKHSSLPDSALMNLIALLKDEGRDVRSHAADVLSKHSSLPDSALMNLIALLKDDSRGVRSHAADVLSKHSSLPDSALMVLIALLKDDSRGVRSHAAYVLSKHSSLPDSALKDLVALLKDEGRDVRSHAADVLSKHSSLPDSALKDLVALLKDEGKDARSHAADVLSKHSSLPDSALKDLVALLKDEGKDARSHAADVLSKQSSFSGSPLLDLIALLRVKGGDVSHAADVLSKQSSLSGSPLLHVIALLKDKSRDVSHVAYLLSQQSSLSDSALLALIALAKDGDWYMKRSAADALGKHRWMLYRLLPTLNSQKIKFIYEKYLLKQRFDQSAPFYIQDGALYFFTAEGLQTVLFSNLNQEAEFRKAVQQAQQAAGYLSIRDSQSNAMGAF